MRVVSPFQAASSRGDREGVESTTPLPFAVAVPIALVLFALLLFDRDALLFEEDAFDTAAVGFATPPILALLLLLLFVVPSLSLTFVKGDNAASVIPSQSQSTKYCSIGETAKIEETNLSLRLG
jgi:hypothetical protein